MCIGQVGDLLAHVAVPAIMPQHLKPIWPLSASEAGLLASSFAVGYMLTVSVLTALSDRLDARLILLTGSAGPPALAWSRQSRAADAAPRA
jgi:nitrate/nitrite transporter NarK